MMLLSLILFGLVLAIISYSAGRDLSTMELVEPDDETDDTNTIRVAV